MKSGSGKMWRLSFKNIGMNIKAGDSLNYKAYNKNECSADNKFFFYCVKESCGSSLPDTLFCACTDGKKKSLYLIYFNTNYRTEMKLVSIIMDYYLLQFDALKFFIGIRLHEGSVPNFNFVNVNPRIYQ